MCIYIVYVHTHISCVSIGGLWSPFQAAAGYVPGPGIYSNHFRARRSVHARHLKHVVWSLVQLTRMGRKAGVGSRRPESIHSRAVPERCISMRAIFFRTLSSSLSLCIKKVTYLRDLSNINNEECHPFPNTTIPTEDLKSHRKPTQASTALLTSTRPQLPF